LTAIFCTFIVSLCGYGGKREKRACLFSTYGGGGVVRTLYLSSSSRDNKN